jgi:hypothetical protein
MLLPEWRLAQIRERLAKAFSGTSIRVLFAPCRSTAVNAYFPETLDALSPLSDGKNVEIVSEQEEPAGLVVATVHGADVAPWIWARRAKFPDEVMLIWLWDNHIAKLNNLASAMASDIVLPSHAYAAQYLNTPIAFLGPHLPLCCAQWRADEPGDLGGARSEKLMAHYVDYDWSQRSALLAEMAASMPKADVRRLPPEDRRPYFAQSRSERLREWLGYKVSLVLPIERDLSTRLFDALFAGQMVLAPRTLDDLDAVIPPADQERLGILRLEDLTLEAIRDAHEKAAARFDREGVAGALERHLYAAQGHMLVHRLDAAVRAAHMFHTGVLQPRFVVAHGASGLRLV